MLNILTIGMISVNLRASGVLRPKISQPPNGSLAFLHSLTPNGGPMAHRNAEFHRRKEAERRDKPAAVAVPEESQPETDDDILRSLGWWLLPHNGDGPGVPD